MIQIDLEMPDRCGNCPCFHFENPMYCQAIDIDRNKKITAPYRAPRPEWCPLQEVPSTNDGKRISVKGRMPEPPKEGPDRGNTIKAIEICYTLGHNCTECPLFSEDDCNDKLMRDALSLLKEQEPRVMTITEAYTADFAYVECVGVITPALRTSNEREGHRESYFATQQLGGEWMRWADYDITWRCWTSRPTEEQRKEEPWPC